MKLRWGILGVAKINERLIPGFARAANAELRAGMGVAGRRIVEEEFCLGKAAARWAEILRD